MLLYDQGDCKFQAENPKNSERNFWVFGVRSTNDFPIQIKTLPQVESTLQDGEFSNKEREGHYI